MALWLESVLLLAGQTSTHTPQPVQSSGATWIVSRCPGSSRDRNSLWRKSTGAAVDRGGREDLHPDRRVRADHRALAAVDADRRDPRSGSSGRSPASRTCAVPVGNVPSTGRALTGSWSPSPAISRAVIRATKSGTSSGTRDGGRPLVGDGTERHVTEALERTVDGGEVALDDGLAALRVGLLDERLDLGDGLVGRQDRRRA